MTIINTLKDLVQTTIRKVLIPPTLMIIDFMLFLLTRAVKTIMKIYVTELSHVKHYDLMAMKIENIRPEKLTDIDQLTGNSVRKNSK